MQITRETDYAIRCVYYLSCNKRDDVTMVEEIARKMHSPKSFLAKILQKLAKADIVKSYRGVKGGFALAKRPREITLLDVIEAVQGPVIMNICALDRRMCRVSGTCSIHPAWIEVRKQVENLLKKKNFASFRCR